MNEDLKKRDVHRKSFLHYEVKLRKMREERTKKKLTNVNYSEPDKLKQKFARNEKKYEKAFIQFEG
jgi:hypothetical protein